MKDDRGHIQSVKSEHGTSKAGGLSFADTSFNGK